MTDADCLARHPTADWKIAEVMPSFWQPLPRTMGSDFAGRVLAWEAPADSSKISFEPAERLEVFGLFPIREISSYGSLSQYAIANMARMTAKPSNVPLATSGGLSITAMTALKLALHVKKGQTVLLLGSTTTVGLLLADLLKSPLIEASYVCGTASSSKMAFLEQRDKLDETIDYRKQDVETILAEKHSVSSDAAFDVILDCVGSPRTLERCEAFLKPAGSYVNVGASDGVSGRFISSMLPLVKAVLKTTLLPRWLGGISRKYINEAPRYEANDWRQLCKALENGYMRPVVDSTYAFDDVKAAYEKLIGGRVLGKILIDVKGAARGSPSS